MSEWSAGAVFSLVWLIVALPIHILSMILFWQRREIQPIKARFPTLVISNDLVLLGWELCLCVQRIVVDSYPCLLNLWTGFIGLTVLFNTYLWRCWVLYFTFGLTQERLEGMKKMDSFFLKNRYLVNNQFLIQIFGTLTILLNLPAGIITSQNPEIADLHGDNCNRGKGDAVLAAYVAVYFISFCGLAWKLRQVVDGFKIKEELRYTALLTPVIFIPWIIFNNITGARTINSDFFPFSTFFLLVGVFLAFTFSSLWPLYRSYFAPPQLDELTGNVENLSTMEGLLSDKAGLASFKKFLTKEFSVENILFYEEIEEYRTKKRKGISGMDLMVEAQRIYAKYIITDSPFQVNLPDVIIKDLETALKELFAQAANQGQAVPVWTSSKSSSNIAADAAAANLAVPTAHVTRPLSTSDSVLPVRTPPTLFDRAQENIFKLMNSDSFPRYQRSDEYKMLLAEVQKRETKLTILHEEGLHALSSERKDAPSPRSTSK